VTIVFSHTSGTRPSKTTLLSSLSPATRSLLFTSLTTEAFPLTKSKNGFRGSSSKRDVRVIAHRHVCSATDIYFSVYVRNLEERIKVDQLKEALTELFSEYGEIIDIVAKTNLKAKGQAFIVFDSIESAQKAIDEVQGFELFDKPMQLAFAKTRSDATVKRNGDEEDFESHKRRRLAEKGMQTAFYACVFTLLTSHRQEESG
jgi:RNA recognition motif-containing protein